VARARISLKAVRSVPADLRTAAQWRFLHAMHRFENRLDSLNAHELSLLPVLVEAERAPSPPRPPPDTADMPVLEENDSWEDYVWTRPRGNVRVDSGEESESEEEEDGVMVAPEP